MITHDLLVKIGACISQREKFDYEWPDGAQVTIKNTLRAIELELDIDWFIVLFFTPQARKVYKQADVRALKAYEQAIALTAKAHKQATDQMREAYEQMINPTWETYRQATAPAWEAYKQGMALAWEAYRQAIARAFVKGYNQTIKAKKG